MQASHDFIWTRVTCDNRPLPRRPALPRARTGSQIERAGRAASTSSMTYTTRVISTVEEFTALRETWDELVSAAVDQNTFLTHAWLHSWWSAYQPSASLRIVLAENMGLAVGIAPMMVQREGGLGKLMRRLRFVGDGTSETDHTNFIVRADDRRNILAALLAAVDDIGWDMAYFSQMPEESANTLQLLEHATDRGWLVDRRIMPCPRRHLPTSYDELLRSLPSRMRTSIRSARRELEAKFKVDFGQYERHEDLPEALEALYRNHAGRWKAKGEEGVFVSDRKRAFYKQLSSRLLDQDTLRFFYLKVDGRVVAQQYCFAHADTVFLLQEGFDIDFAKQNVGNVLRAMVFEQLIAEGTRTYDFLAGMSRHKQSWSDNVLNDLIVRAFRPTLSGRLAHGLANWRRKVNPSDATREDAAG